MDSGELQKIIKAAELVNSDLHVNVVLKNIVNVAVELTNADRGTLYLVDYEKDVLWSFFASGKDTQEIRLKIGEGLAGYVAKSGETINIKDVSKDSRFHGNFDQVTGYKTKNMICFPIKNNKSEIVGVLQLLNSHNGEFKNRDEKFLFALSIHAAIAINNALMLQKQISINEELILAKKEAEKFAMLRTHFLAQMSHEIRTPLNIVSGGMALLKLNLNPSQSEELSELFHMLESGSARIVRTIDEIIEMSKIRVGDYELQVEKIKLEDEILLPLIEISKKSAEKNEIEINFQRTTDKNIVSVDRFMVNQIFTEIVDNAIKFTKQGSVSIKQFVDDAGILTVSIKDTGIGISQEYMKQIFEPFTQEQTGYTRTYEGNGLALALVKKYADLNNLTIIVSSEKNIGSEFKIVFN